MKQFYSYFLLPFIVICLSIGCTHFDEPVMPEEAAQSVETRATINAAALRASAGVANINNPYSVANMRKAMNQISAVYGTQPKPIYATHDYVRFLPKDSLDMYVLEDSLGLLLIEYPIDRILTDAECEFYSNDLIGEYGWLYTLVPKNFRYPSGIETEVLQEVYVQGSGFTTRTDDAAHISPQLIGGGSSGGTTLADSEYDLIVAQAMKNAGIETVGGGATSTGGSNSWTPSATITYYDTTTQSTVGLEGVFVRVTTLLNAQKGYTDKNGKITFAKGWAGTFKNKVRYVAKFESPYWQITNPSNKLVKLSSAQDKIHWACQIGTNRELSVYATVHRVLRYFFYTQDEITKPTYRPKKIKVNVLWNQSHPDYAGLYTGKNKGIIIWGKREDPIGNYSQSTIARVTFHELGHASHHKAMQNIKEEKNMDDIISQSYADAVAYYLMRKFLPGYPDTWDTTYNPEKPQYTLIGEALFCQYGQGLTLKQLESSVLRTNKWDDWKQNVIRLNVLPAWMVNFLFDNPTQKWDFDLLSGSITNEYWKSYAYVGEPINFTLNSAFLNSGANIVSWSTSSAKDNIEVEDAGRVMITFNTTGLHVVFCNIKLPSGDTFSASSIMNVRQSPTVTGNKIPRIGTIQTYVVDDNTRLEGWNLGHLDENDNFTAASESFIMNPYNLDDFICIITEPGDYVVRATFFIGGSKEYIYYPITVPSEGQPVGNDLAPSLCKVETYKHKTDGSIKHIIHKSRFTQVLNDHILQGDSCSFKTFNKKPFEDHPLYNKLIPIYRVTYREHDSFSFIAGGVKNMNGLPLYFTGLPSYLDFYVLNEQVAGTVPLYSVELVVKNRAGEELSYCRFLSLKSVNGTWQEGADMISTYRTIETLGYVYPLEWPNN